MEAAEAVIDRHGRLFTGDLAAHAETGFGAPVALANGWTLVGTDVGGDGGYIIARGKIVACGLAFDE